MYNTFKNNDPKRPDHMSTARLLKDLDESEQDIKTTPANPHSTGWETMPLVIKRLTGSYLFKESVWRPRIQSTATLNILLSDRRNMDLPYKDRSLEGECYAGLLCKMVSAACTTPAPKGCGGGCAWLIMLVLSIPVGFVASSGGIVVDGVCTAKKSCDESRDEKLHSDIVGPPVRQKMR
jgi:hypothetical protein